MSSAQAKIKITSKDTELSIAIREQLKSRVAEIENVRFFERKNGLTPGTINNIINGTSSNPTAETLNTLANALDCTIDELLNRSSLQQSNSADSTILKDSEWQSDLYISVTAELANQIKKNQIKVSSEKAIYIAKELYSYLLKKNKTTVDDSLIGWVLDKAL